MDPINSCSASNEISSAYATSLAEKYGLTEQYSTDYPEDFKEVFLLVQSFEDNFQAAERMEQALEKLSNSVTRLEEGNKILRTQTNEMIESMEETLQDLKELTKSSAEIKAITSNIANMVSICANRIFKPIQSGMNRLTTGRKEPAAVLPRENQLAIEYNPENTISDTDPTNQPPVDEKKKRTNFFKFCAVVGGLCLLHAGEQRIL
jgi:hypothetical protein